MEHPDLSPKQEQIERARRLREEIEALKQGKQEPDEHPSLREQINERARKISESEG
jgi:hypothetical protein